MSISNTSNYDEHYSEKEEKALRKPLYYFVAQIQRKKIILTLVRTRHNKIEDDVPMLMDINHANVSPTPKCRPFDLILVHTYTVTMFDGIEQNIQKFKTDTIRDRWKNQMIISTTHVKSYEVIHRRNEVWIPGDVQYTQHQTTTRSG